MALTCSRGRCRVANCWYLQRNQSHPSVSYKALAVTSAPENVLAEHCTSLSPFDFWNIPEICNNADSTSVGNPGQHFFGKFKSPFLFITCASRGQVHQQSLCSRSDNIASSLTLNGSVMITNACVPRNTLIVSIVAADTCVAPIGTLPEPDVTRGDTAGDVCPLPGTLAPAVGR